MHRRTERRETDGTVGVRANGRDGLEDGPIDDDGVLFGRLRVWGEERIQDVMYRELLVIEKQDGFRARRPDIDANGIQTNHFLTLRVGIQSTLLICEVDATCFPI